MPLEQDFKHKKNLGIISFLGITSTHFPDHLDGLPAVGKRRCLDVLVVKRMAG